MKRLISLFLGMVLTVSLCACSQQTSSRSTSVNFYYLRAEQSYSGSDSVIVSESQDTLDRTDGLNYILALYLNGPVNDLLISPFPKDLKIISAKTSDNVLVLTLNDAINTLKGIGLTKACACLALTCMDLTNADVVSIQSFSGSETQNIMNLSREDILLQDLTPESTLGGTE